MKHVLTIAACVLYMFNNVQAQQTGTYTTYIGGKAEVVDQWTTTTDADTLKTEGALGKPGAVGSQRAVTIAVNHRPKSFVLLAGENELIGADYVQPRNIPKYVVDDIVAWIKETGMSLK